MPLSETMLKECKEIIFEQSSLPEDVKEPVHMAVKNLIVLENAYEGFLSRENCGEMTRANPLFELVNIHGGSADALINWFTGYEVGNEGAAPGIWGG